MEHRATPEGGEPVMITVRFPNGQAVQYNTATCITRENGEWKLYTTAPDKGGALVAMIQASAGVLCEWVYPCRVYDAPQREPQAEIKNELRAIRRKIKKGGSV